MAERQILRYNRLMARAVYRLLALGAAAAILALVSGGCGDSASGTANPAEEQRALVKYRAFLDEHASAFTSAVESLLGPIRTHKVPRSESLFVITRVPYGAIAPEAESFTDLNSKITSEFHRIERGLWLKETTDELKPVAKELRASSEALQRKIKAAPLEPRQISIDIEKLLHEVSTVRIVGKAQPYANADLVDVAANIEGAEAAFAALKPLLSEEGQSLGRVQAQFQALFAALGEYGTLARESREYRAKAAGAIFFEYSDLNQAEVHGLAVKIEGLATQLSTALAPLLQGQS